MTENKAR